MTEYNHTICVTKCLTPEQLKAMPCRCPECRPDLEPPPMTPQEEETYRELSYGAAEFPRRFLRD